MDGIDTNNQPEMDWIAARVHNIREGGTYYTNDGYAETILLHLQKFGKNLDDCPDEQLSHEDKNLIWNARIKHLGAIVKQQFFINKKPTSSELDATMKSLQEEFQQFAYQGKYVTFEDIDKSIAASATEPNAAIPNTEFAIHHKIIQKSLHEYEADKAKRGDKHDPASVSNMNTCIRIAKNMAAIQKLNVSADDQSKMTALTALVTPMMDEVKEVALPALQKKRASVRQATELGEAFYSAYYAFGDSDPRVQEARTKILTSPDVKRSLLRDIMLQYQNEAPRSTSYGPMLLHALYPEQSFDNQKETLDFLIKQNTASQSARRQ